ncbi:MAG: hypothetical protein Q8P13_02325 [bacterium]|nr:hypothetical protein [bacterium]
MITSVFFDVTSLSRFEAFIATWLPLIPVTLGLLYVVERKHRREFKKRRFRVHRPSWWDNDSAS